MTETHSIPAQEAQSSTKMLRAMVGIGALCALLIVLTYEGTLPRVERLKSEALEKAIFKVLPGTEQTKMFILDENNRFVQIIGKDNPGQVIYTGYDASGKITGMAIEASGQGYADILRILYGYEPETQKVVGFYVLESKETPGLGDKIEKDPNFLANFIALDVSLNEDQSGLQNSVTPVKQGEKQHPWEVDGITGATISSRAIGNIINASAQQWVPLIYRNKSDFILQKDKK